ncbi:glycosyltransferase [Anaeromyxobacter soli]|uniref:glycosyltransferase n=1 Tax=Anaeromyxobacter soli TaxID=2922725 RepID=UPI001FAF12CB|nr:glycosyltransferase [Anaeromyxobacter sp. SG29]
MSHDAEQASAMDPGGIEKELAEARLALARERARTSRLREDLERTGERLRRTEAELEGIRTSTAWRAARVYYRVRDGFWPLRVAHGLARKAKARLGGMRAVGAAARSLLPDGGGQVVGLTLGRRGRVSVVLPVYNQASMLAESIESVLAQTYRDLELIVVNDGSTDGVEPILERFADDPRVVVVTQPNQKLPSALNNGFDFATGEFYTWTSADNVMLPRQLEVLVGYLRAHPEQAMVFSDYQAIDDRGRPLDDPLFRPQNQDPHDRSRMRLPREVTVENLHRSGDNFIGASFLYRRDAARVVGAYAEDTFGGEDYDYWLRIHALFGIGHVEEVLYRYRVHENTLNARARELRIAESVHRLLDRHGERLAALASSPAWLQLGVEIPGARSVAAGATPDVVAYALSRAGDPAVREREDSDDALRVCVVDLPLDQVDEAAARRAELLFAADPLVAAHLDRELPGGVFLLDPRREPELARRIAQLRLFEKRCARAPRQPPARVLPVREPLRVGFQVDGMDRGGLEQIVSDLVRNLDRSRVRPTVLVHATECGLTGRALQKDGVDVVVTGGVEGRLIAAAQERQLQVVNLHHSVAGLTGYRGLGLSTVYTVHSSYVWLDPQARSARAERLRDVDLHLAVSPQVGRFFEATFGVDPRRVRIVPNGLDPRALEGASRGSREELGLSEGDFVFLQVGSFTPNKLQRTTVEALARVSVDVPRARLVLVGNPLDARYAREVDEAVRAGGLSDRVRILPWGSRDAIAGLIRAADCFVLPSLVEGWSIAVMEAMYFGLPLVVSDVGSAREVIHEGDIGIVIPCPYERLSELTLEQLVALGERPPEEYVEVLAAAMREVALHPDAWRARGARGREKVMGPFHVRAMADAYAGAYVDAYRWLRKTGTRRA